MAKVAEDYFAGSAREAEAVFGWSRKSVQLGLHEQLTISAPLSMSCYSPF